jgi:hypothetical protein
MIYVFRMYNAEHFEAMRVALEGTPHRVELERTATAVRSRVDAEFFSLGLAERFGARPSDRNGVAYIIRSDREYHASNFIITGVTLDGNVTPRQELAIIFRAISACVSKHNTGRLSEIRTVGFHEIYLWLTVLRPVEIVELLRETV